MVEFFFSSNYTKSMTAQWVSYCCSPPPPLPQQQIKFHGHVAHSSWIYYLFKVMAAQGAACYACRLAHTACLGGRPCSRCKTMGFTCQPATDFIPPRKRGRPPKKQKSTTEQQPAPKRSKTTNTTTGWVQTHFLKKYATQNELFSKLPSIPHQTI